MSRHQGQLPREVCGRVFRHLETNDLLTCLSVCKAWHIAAKPYFYKEIEFKRIDSIDGFIAHMQMATGHPNLLVRKVTFTCYDFEGKSPLEYHTFQQKFHHLAALCPHIETLISSPKLTDSVVEALCCVNTPFKNLAVFPYSKHYRYKGCAHYYRRTLKEYTLSTEEHYYMVKNFGLRKFPHLQKLFMMCKPVKTLRDVECILRICQKLEHLSVKVFNGDDVVTIEDEQMNDPCVKDTHAYPVMKHLSCQIDSQEFDFEQFMLFLRKLNCLERLDLETFDILTAERPSHQLKELIRFLDYIHVLPSVYLMVKSVNISDFSAAALQYLQLFFRPVYPGKPIALKLQHAASKGFDQLNELHYTNDIANGCALAMKFPLANYETHLDAYVETFAPYVETLEIDYNLQPCDSFLDTVLTRCTMLHSLTLIQSNCCNPLPVFAMDDNSPSATVNTSLHTLVLSSCPVTPEFLSSLSYACSNLCRLIIDDTRWTAMSHISMPNTELQQLDLDLGFLAHQGYETTALITVVESNRTRYFYTDFAKKQYMIPHDMSMLYKGYELVLTFKKIEQLRVYFSIDDHQYAFELTE
jgi:hypothetical protein